MISKILVLVVMCIPLFAHAEKHEWNESTAKGFVELSLHCVDTELPNYWERFEPKERHPALERHPAFYGCYDWHSAVHGHWAMLRVWKSFPSIDVAKRIEETLDRHLTQENIDGELKFLRANPSFENPYGYGWFFRLLQELNTFDHPNAKIWSARLQPITDLFIQNYAGSIGRINRPYRIGTHDSTAFAMTHILDYARSAGNQSLADLVRAKAVQFYVKDKNCPMEYEPGPYDFISPCMIEADLMRRVLVKEDYRNWLQRFFSDMEESNPIFTPVIPSDLKDPYLGHQIGLMFQKAAAMKAVAAEMDKKSVQKKWLEDSSEIHSSKGIDLMFDSGYGGSHWLASFAIFHFSDAWKTAN